LTPAPRDPPAEGPPAPFPRRARDAHKGSVGTVLVVAGSRGMSGAAVLTGEAALRSGAGLVTVASPDQTQRAVELKTTCLVTKPLPETATGALARGALDALPGLIEGKGALAVGPGLSRDPETVEVVRALVAWLGRAVGPRLVLDADGLNAFEGQADLLRAVAGRAVLTPHPGEFARLVGASPEALNDRSSARVARDRRASLEAFVARTGVTTLLKGAGTLVGRARPGGGVDLWENTTGNPGMATAGSGDVLTGVVAALLAAGLEPWDAARLGAWLHGRAGDLAAREWGWAALTATDLLPALGRAIREVEVR
jgi:hydroxyethylthiazole kinase-like uncharacterized protein yjeF